MSEQRTGRRGQRTVRRKIATAAMAIGVVLFGIAVAPGVASAHHPVVSGQTSCRIDCWSVTWTARADEIRDLNWSDHLPGAATAPAGFAVGLSCRSPVPPPTRVAGLGHRDGDRQLVERRHRVELGDASSAHRCARSNHDHDHHDDDHDDHHADHDHDRADHHDDRGGTTTTAADDDHDGRAGRSDHDVGRSAGADQHGRPVVGRGHDDVGGALPATGTGDGSANLMVIALTLIGIGAVMLRLASKPTR